jgi:dipeptidyl aminopeptidase/acylaminoacyl peptidase
LHQWLANRGYAALSINFRGSLGFSKAFVNAGNGEWGGRVQNDIADAVRWAVDSRVAREDRVAILGAGFGGYLALAGVALSPGQYRCSASFGGPINLGSFVEQTPAPTREEIRARIGDARTPEGRQALRDASPLFRANRVENAVLLALGGRDARLVRGEFDQFAQALRSRESGLTYAVFPGEGRELRQPANRLAYYAILEHFLGDCLGGREEPVGAAFEGARIDVFDGAVNVPGLSAFARRPAEVTRAAPTLDSAASPHEDIASAPDAPQPVELEPLSVP